MGSGQWISGRDADGRQNEAAGRTRPLVRDQLELLARPSDSLLDGAGDLPNAERLLTKIWRALNRVDPVNRLKEDGGRAAVARTAIKLPAARRRRGRCANLAERWEVAMKICVLGLRGLPHVMGGVETHCEQLFPLMKGLHPDDSFTIIGRRGYLPEEFSEYHGLRIVSLPHA